MKVTPPVYPVYPFITGISGRYFLDVVVQQYLPFPNEKGNVRCSELRCRKNEKNRNSEKRGPLLLRIFSFFSEIVACDSGQGLMSLRTQSA